MTSKKWTLARAVLATSILCGVLAASSIAHGRAAKPATLEPYLGSCELAPGAILTISREGTRSTPRPRASRNIGWPPISEHRFSDAVSRAELHFALGGDGRAVSVTHHLDGAAGVAKRTEAAGAQAAAKAQAQESTGTPPTDPAPLANAALARDVDAVRKLVAEGADIHGLDTRPATAGGNGRR